MYVVLLAGFDHDTWRAGKGFCTWQDLVSAVRRTRCHDVINGPTIVSLDDGQSGLATPKRHFDIHG